MRRVLIIDDDPENVDLLSRYLSQEGHSVQTATDSETALHRVKAWKPQLVLLDVNLGKSSGLDLIPKIRAVTHDDYVAIVLVSANLTPDDVNKGIDSGADDYLTKPFRAQELISRVRTMLRMKETQDSLRRALSRIEELSSTDDLTGHYNMRALYRRGEEEISRARRFKKPLSALMVNLDDFSSVNQNFGFLFGSHVILEVGRRLRRCVRSIDLIARVGADEFFVLLVETDLANAEFMAERIRDAIQSAPFRNDKQSTKITASIGVAAITQEREEQKMGDFLNITYEALRSAKLNGPNKIEIYSFA